MRSLACRSFAQAIALADALSALGYESCACGDSKGRPTLLTSAPSSAIDSIL